LSNFWQTFGKLLANFWQTFGKLLANLYYKIFAHKNKKARKIQIFRAFFYPEHSG
jgi:hypothetical protein